MGAGPRSHPGPAAANSAPPILKSEYPGVRLDRIRDGIVAATTTKLHCLDFGCVGTPLIARLGVASAMAQIARDWKCLDTTSVVWAVSTELLSANYHIS